MSFGDFAFASFKAVAPFLVLASFLVGCRRRRVRF